MLREKRWRLGNLIPGFIPIGLVAITLTGCLTTAHCLCPPDCVGQSKGGAELWSENCARCHNNRPATTYSDAEWDVAMHHMRIRANLTGEEHKKVVEFLKSGN